LTTILVPIAIANHATPSPVGELVRDAGNNLKPDTEFAVVDFQEPNAIWEMRRVVKGYAQSIPEAEVATFLNQPGPHAVILSDQAFGRLQENRNLLLWKFYSARGFNAAKGSFIDLTLVLKP
jgi:hypothetical protein